MALSKNREAQLGRSVMLQLRNAGVVIDDPQLTEYIGTLGSQLASHANNGDYQFQFLLRQRRTKSTRSRCRAASSA